MRPLGVLLAACLTAALIVGSPHSVRAAGPFDRSTLTPSGPPPAEGEVFRYVVTLVNDGEDASAAVDVAIPSAALLAGVEGLPGAALDESSRTVRWQGDMAPGTSRVATVDFVAGLDAGGQSATVRVTVRPGTRDPTYLVHVAEVDTRPAASVIRLGSIGITAAGAVVFGWLAGATLLWLVLRLLRPDVAAWAPIAILFPLAFLAYFGWLAREDARIARLPTVECTVLDRELDARTASSTAGRSSRASTVYKPWLAVSYPSDGTTKVAQGFGTDSALSRGSAASAEAIMNRYAVGARVPCAVDDRDPRRAYVERGFGGAYLFALLPLPLLALGLWGLTRERGRR